MRLYVTPASPWVRRVRVSILELGIENEIWEQGKVRPGSTSNPTINKTVSLSFSIKEGTNTKGQRIFRCKRMWLEGDYSTAVTEDENVPECFDNSRRTTGKLFESREINEVEKLAVWSYVLLDRNSKKPFSSSDSIEETAKAAQWALVVKVWWKKHGH